MGTAASVVPRYFLVNRHVTCSRSIIIGVSLDNVDELYIFGHQSNSQSQSNGFPASKNLGRPRKESEYGS